MAKIDEPVQNLFIFCIPEAAPVNGPQFLRNVLGYHVADMQ